jgi:polar amino acid transport system permease protein
LPDLLAGAAVTIEITALSMVMGVAFALALALARRAEKGGAYLTATACVEVARNTPLLFQIYMIYFGLGAQHINVSSFTATLAAVTFNNAGYLAEVFRAALNAIPTQQLSAARSLGLSLPQAYRHVLFPQLLRIVFLPIVVQLNWAMLGTSLGMTVGLHELSGATLAAQSVSYRTFEFFIVAATMYYLIGKFIQLGAWLIAATVFRS